MSEVEGQQDTAGGLSGSDWRDASKGSPPTRENDEDTSGEWVLENWQDVSHELSEPVIAEQTEMEFDWEGVDPSPRPFQDLINTSEEIITNPPSRLQTIGAQRVERGTLPKLDLGVTSSASVQLSKEELAVIAENIPSEVIIQALDEHGGESNTVVTNPSSTTSNNELPDLDITTLDFIYKSVMLVGAVFSAIAAIFMGWVYGTYDVTILTFLIAGFLFWAYKRGLKPIYVGR